MGSIDVNIMTKVDKENRFNNEKLPVEYNDAHAALRAGATPEQVREAIGVAVMMGGGPVYMYAAHAMEALEEFSA